MICIIGICFSGCKETDDSTKCRLKVVSSYSGWGIDGQDLGSGKFTDTFSVSEKDLFYELSNGHWSKEKKEDTAEIILSITKIDENGVTIQIGETETVLNYDVSKDIDSRYIVYDGTNYKYTFRFIK